MRLLLDTHILVWMATEPDRLLKIERDAVRDPGADLFASSISFWELRAKVRAERRRGKRDLMIDPAGMERFCRRVKIVVDEFTLDDSKIALRFDPPHGDPFDEMLLAHTQRLGARLLTRDTDMVDHPLAYRP